MEVRDIVQEAGIKKIPKEKKSKKPKWLSEEGLQIVVKRREVKSKGEKERYTHLNAEFKRIARKDKKAFLSDQYKETEENNRKGKTRDLFMKTRDNKAFLCDQCKEIEENNRMGKTRDLFKNIRDTKGTFHANMGSKGQKCYEPNRSRRY